MVEGQSYTNEQLASQYIAIMSQSSGPLPYMRVRNAISDCEKDITSFFQDCGTLIGFEIQGVSRNTMRVLELILREGVESSREIVYERKIKGLTQYFRDKGWPDASAGKVTKGKKRKREIKP